MFRLLAALVMAALPIVAAATGKFTIGDLVIADAFARATPAMARNGAAYLAISNTGTQPDRLLSVRADAASRVELHSHVDDGGVMRMRPIEGGIAVPAGSDIALSPGGDHVMLMGLQEPLVEGASFPLTLVFERAGEVTIEVAIRGIAASTGSGHRHH